MENLLRYNYTLSNLVKKFNLFMILTLCSLFLSFTGCRVIGINPNVLDHIFKIYPGLKVPPSDRNWQLVFPNLSFCHKKLTNFFFSFLLFLDMLHIGLFRRYVTIFFLLLNFLIFGVKSYLSHMIF